jgi:hypothetical protein
MILTWTHKQPLLDLTVPFEPLAEISFGVRSRDPGFLATAPQTEDTSCQDEEGGAEGSPSSSWTDDAADDAAEGMTGSSLTTGERQRFLEEVEDFLTFIAKICNTIYNIRTHMTHNINTTMSKQLSSEEGLEP